MNLKSRTVNKITSTHVLGSTTGFLHFMYNKIPLLPWPNHVNPWLNNLKAGLKTAKQTRWQVCISCILIIKISVWRKSWLFWWHLLLFNKFHDYSRPGKQNPFSMTFPSCTNPDIIKWVFIHLFTNILVSFFLSFFLFHWLTDWLTDWHNSDIYHPWTIKQHLLLISKMMYRSMGIRSTQNMDFSFPQFTILKINSIPCDFSWPNYK